MGKGKGPWNEGRRAFERLRGWHQEGSARPVQPADGAGAVQALADIGFVRRLLDQAELAAVRTARRRDKSWAEIATQLGVTRQSAWERWRELDEVADPASASTAPRAEAAPDAAADLLERAARERATRRHPNMVVVPNVVGLSWEDARQVLHGAGLVGVGPDPDGPPLAELAPDAVVTDQSPESGVRIPSGSAVTLWVERGGGSGVREPRHPTPTPRTGRAMKDEPTNEAVA